MTIKGTVDEETQKLIQIIHDNGVKTIDFSNEEIKKQIISIISENQDKIFPKILSGEYKVAFLTQMILRWLRSSQNTPQVINFYQKEVDFIGKMAQKKKIKELLYALIIWEKLNPHETHWINFDMQNILRSIYSESEISKFKNEDFVPLKDCGLEFRVIGSKLAIPCYKLPIEIESEPTIEKPIFSFEYNKENCKNVFLQIIKRGDMNE